MHPLVFHPRWRASQDTSVTERRSVCKSDAPRLQIGMPPFDVRTLADGTLVGIAVSGDHLFLQRTELEILLHDPDQLPLKRKAELAARFFLPNHGRNVGKERLLAARRAAKRETVAAGPSLHIIVPTLHNRGLCELDLFDAAPMLERASRVLDRYQVRHVVSKSSTTKEPVWTMRLQQLRFSSDRSASRSLRPTCR